MLRAGDRLRAEAACTTWPSGAHRDPLVDLITWDDDVRDTAPGRPAHDPRFRPSWSPEMLLGANYVGRAFAMRRARYLAIGGVRAEAGAAMHWDLLLRSGLEAERVTRVARVLSSVARRERRAGPDGVRVVQQHLDRAGRPASAEAAGDVVRVRWDAGPTWPKVSVVIPTRHNRAMLVDLPAVAGAHRLPATSRWSIVDNGGRTPENEQWYADNDAGARRSTSCGGTSRRSTTPRSTTPASTRTGGEVLVFLNDDTELLDPAWMKELVGWARASPRSASWACSSSAPTASIQHAGVILGLERLRRPRLRGHARRRSDTPLRLRPTGTATSWP